MTIDPKNLTLKSSLAVVLALLVFGVGGRWLYISMSMRSLAQDTCAELDGAMVIQAGPILKKAVSRAERLGFTGPDLGDRMRDECPSLMRALEERAAEAQARSQSPR